MSLRCVHIIVVEIYTENCHATEAPPDYYFGYCQLVFQSFTAVFVAVHGPPHHVWPAMAATDGPTLLFDFTCNSYML